MQLTKTSNVTTNTFSSQISENDIGFSKTTEQRAFLVGGVNVHDTGILSDGEHVPQDGSYLVSKDEWVKS